MQVMRIRLKRGFVTRSDSALPCSAAMPIRMLSTGHGAKSTAVATLAIWIAFGASLQRHIDFALPLASCPRTRCTARGAGNDLQVVGLDAPDTFSGPQGSYESYDDDDDDDDDYDDDSDSIDYALAYSDRDYRIEKLGDDADVHNEYGGGDPRDHDDTDDLTFDDDDDDDYD